MSAAVSSASRSTAIARALAYADSGALRRDLAGLVARRSVSQAPEQRPELYDYLRAAVAPRLEGLGFSCRIEDNPVQDGPPFLLAERIEAANLPTVLLYAHGDVVRGYDEQWRDGLSPWTLVEEGERWYGRGTADNKGQYCINVAALEQVLAERGGRLGFNARMLVECGEEVGSPGLHAACGQWRDALKADVFIASDGPRLAADLPTLFLGSRGTLLFDLEVNLRSHAHHSGNWGGVLPNPGLILAHALASLVDARGRLQVDGLRPPPIPAAVRRALSTIEVGRDDDAPETDPDWGEPGLSLAERLFGWNTLEVLAYKTGNPDNPVGAIPGRAAATCNLRFVVGTDWRAASDILRAHLDAHGFGQVQVKVRRGTPATRLDPDDAWARWAAASLAATTGAAPAILPNLGGTVPNDAFSDVLGLPTIWVPHSYPACCQHGPDEHLLAPVARQAMAIMAGLFWDLGEQGPAVMAERQAATAG
ncbi:M20 family metallopeptidase [Achromobacter sp. 413638]|uniref:M20 family metallopeptidase n=1 Tax=Achromobacter sp. 413638 TaxID=3342385 RepID=UPI00370B5732